MASLVVTGPLSRDVVAGGEPRIGGGAWHAGRALAALGADARIVTACGAEDEAAFRAQLDGLGLPFELHVAGTTTSFSFSYDDAGTRAMTVDAVGETFSPEIETEWLHVSGLLRGDLVFPSAAHVLLEGQGLVRRPQVGPLEIDAEFDPGVLRGVTVLKLSEREAAVVGPVDVPELIVTHGIRGATVNGMFIPAEPVVADPTGAGDMFAAGYLAARSAGADPPEAGRHATDLVARMLAG